MLTPKQASHSVLALISLAKYYLADAGSDTEHEFMLETLKRQHELTGEEFELYQLFEEAYLDSILG